ncbi:hypothetical protein [Scopulibacillus cellulosilyticus]|uniref:Uncharacterized protein n=1 Tax=Scopulibacillus cellulosilyticus TaxID=2665665 RepID=A0ABW2Q5R4_9BACL
MIKIVGLKLSIIQITLHKHQVQSYQITAAIRSYIDARTNAVINATLKVESMKKL